MGVNGQQMTTSNWNWSLAAIAAEPTGEAIALYARQLNLDMLLVEGKMHQQ